MRHIGIQSWGEGMPDGQKTTPPLPTKKNVKLVILISLLMANLLADVKITVPHEQLIKV